METFKALFRQTLTQPGAAGHRIIAMDLPLQALWMALTFISVATSLLASGMLHLIPIPSDEMGDLLRASLPYGSPLVFALANWGNAVLSVFIFLWVGRVFGGTGQLRHLLAVIVLLQATAITLLVGLVLLGIVLPLVSVMLMLGVGLWTIWAMISLLRVAHNFDSLGNAIGTFLVAAIGVPLGLSLITGTIAALTAGVS